MRRLVVYFSRTGHSRAIAESLSKALDADVSEIVDLKKRTGPFSFFQCAFDARQNKVSEIKLDRNPADYDEVIVVSPIWGGMLPPAINAYVNQYNVTHAIVSSGGPIDLEKMRPLKAKLHADKVLNLALKEWKETEKINQWIHTL